MTRRAIYIIAFILFAALVVWPGIEVLNICIFGDSASASQPAAGVLAGLRQWTLLINTLCLGASVAAGATAVGAAMAWCATRTDLPMRGFVSIAWLGPLFLPALMLGIAWTGMVQIHGFAAIAGIFIFNYYPIAAVFTASSLARADRHALEAAEIAGGRRLARKLLFRQALPSMLAAACGIFIFTIADFSVPDYISSIGPKYNVYSDEVFSRWQRAGDASGAVATSLPPLALGLAAFAAASRLRGRSNCIIRGRFHPAPPRALGPWKIPAVFFVWFVLAVSFMIPVGFFIYTIGSPGVALDALREARRDILNTMIYSAGAAVAALAIALVIGHAAARAGRKTRAAIEAAAALPFALPAIALAIVMIRMWNRGGAADYVYASVGIVIFIMLARFYIFSHAVVSAGLGAVDPDLESAAALAGMGPARRMFLLLPRIAAPSLLGAFLLVFVLSMRELDAIVLIPSGNSSTMFRVYNAIHFNRKEFVAALCAVHVFLTFVPVAICSLFARRGIEVSL
ncbi:MAG: iron ABC transporter permease [Planctomycetes bacterium]|nr:iron ABC transporter permease [Planctomycetota bacterium]